MLLQLLAALVLACATLLLYAYFSYTYWTRRGIPQLPNARFPLGHVWRAITFQRSFGQVCCDLYSGVPTTKPLAGAYFFTKPAAVVRDPDLIKKMLVKDFQHFHDRGLYINEDVDPLTGHLFLLPGERWRLLRNKLSPTFTSGNMKMMFPTMEKCGRELLEVLGSAGEVEFRDVLARYSTDVIASCAFGVEAHCLQHPDGEFRYWGKRLLNPTTGEMLTKTFCDMFPAIANIFRIRSVPADVDNYFTSLVKNTMHDRDTHGTSRADFTHLLMQLRGNESANEKCSQKQSDAKDVKLGLGQLAAQCVVFFVAGFETSATTMGFALHELAWNQDIQRKLQQEVDDTLKESGGQLTYDGVMSMTYLDKVISETLRKYPPVPLLNREVTQPYSVPGTNWTLEKGVAVFFPVMAMQYDPQYFPHPERFDPERFSEEEKSKRPSCVYLPFGDGPRACIGMRFGIMQTKIGLVSLLSQLNIEPRAGTVRELTMNPRSFILNPVSGIQLRYTARAKQNK
ncbi:probable cytochrome P450 6a14 [Schistocerca serialis cubense]|uniref:probable cytochrome P450 6a14 n=1 Tax=Schistocerca serialis cubense TaxID=2023355 RepID=UPI00214EC256|nr:probable cytochrome P450 6a14 [Schistocerca serialis cubense]XP_049962954.1 probable cytochrome P450 6a14 [Schistocerca serialis cubense]